MFLEIGCRRFQIAGFAEAPRMFCAASDGLVSLGWGFTTYIVQQ
jgi:hypothetical protein